MQDTHSKKIAYLLILLHLAITIPFAYLLNVWVDEASTLHNTEHGFTNTLQIVFQTEKQAPLYFLLLSFWRDIDGSVFFARLFSIICSCLAIRFFYDLARKFFSEKQTILISTFFALHPFLIRMSLEIRVYTLIVLLSTLMLRYFYDGYLGSPEPATRRRTQYFFIGLAIVGLYTNYYFGFLLVGGFLALLALARRPAAGTYLRHMFIVALAVSPLVWVIKMQIGLNTAGYKEITGLIDGLKILWGHCLSIAFPTELSPNSEEQTTVSFVRVWLARVGILTAVLLILKNRFRDLDAKVWLFGIFSASVLGFMLFAFSILGGEYISLRHAAVLYVPLVLLLVSLYANLLPDKGWIALVIIFALLFPYSVYQSYPTLAKRGDWKNIAEFIEENENPNQPILTSQAYDAISLPYHYKGINEVLPDERFFEWNPEDSLGSENGYRKQTEFLISKIPPDAEYLWLATRDTCHLPKTEASCRPLENFVREHYTVVIEKNFYLEKLRLLKKK